MNTIPHPSGHIEDFIEVNPGSPSSNFNTIQDAVDSHRLTDQMLPILVVGTHILDSTINLPINFDCHIIFSPGASIDMRGKNFPAFTIPDGLTERRFYKLVNPNVIFNGTSGSEFLRVADTGGYVDAVIEFPDIYKPETVLNFTGYDLTYIRGHRVKFVGGKCVSNGSSSTLVKTLNSGDSFAGFVMVAFDNVDLTEIGVESNIGDIDLWNLNLDGDISFKGDQGHAIGLKEGSIVGGFSLNQYTVIVGDGDFTASGAHNFASGHYKPSSTYGVDQGSRLILGHYMAEIGGYFSGVSVQIAAIMSVRGAYFYDNSGMTNPAIEIIGAATHGSEIVGCFFTGDDPGVVEGHGWPAGCILITSSKYCKIHDNNFIPNILNGYTIAENNGLLADKNIVHDNSGVNNGLGMSLQGTVTVASAHDNI